MANATNNPLTASQLLGSLKASGTSVDYANADFTDNDVAKRTLGSAAARAGSTSASLVGAGGETLGPVLGILSKLLGGDRQSVMEGAQPDVARVSDQYDAARKSIMQNSPRGGGRAMALNESRIKEAGDITTLLNQQRTEARKEAGSIGSQLISQGIQAASNETTALSSLLQSLVSERGQNMGMWGSLMSSLSSTISKLFSGMGGGPGTGQQTSAADETGSTWDSSNVSDTGISDVSASDGWNA